MNAVERHPEALHWLERIRALALARRPRIMNVCGGHERSISMSGLRAALAGTLDLIPGPGCPVCICPEEDVYRAIRIALDEAAIVVAFGDMLRVPVNAPKSEPRSLEAAKAAGADVRAIASPSEAVAIARASPGREVVFFAAGFETTMAPVAAMLSQGVPGNLSVLLSGRLTWPAVAMLLESGSPGFDALICPGHVSTVMGPEQWEFVAAKHGIACAVAGFTPESLLAGIHSVLCQWLAGKPALANCYSRVARPGGNAAARNLLARTMRVTDANWRGIGVIPDSGFALRPPFDAHDARARFPDRGNPARRRAGEMPPGCDCASVVLGRIAPDECRLYARACHPRHPIGPCMVSDEGACRVWWAAGVREPRARGPAASAREGGG